MYLQRVALILTYSVVILVLQWRHRGFEYVVLLFIYLICVSSHMLLLSTCLFEIAISCRFAVHACNGLTTGSLDLRFGVISPSTNNYYTPLVDGRVQIDIVQVISISDSVDNVSFLYFWCQVKLKPIVVAVRHDFGCSIISCKCSKEDLITLAIYKLA